jgi:hypothetical protein
MPPRGAQPHVPPPPFAPQSAPTATAETSRRPSPPPLAAPCAQRVPTVSAWGCAPAASSARWAGHGDGRPGPLQDPSGAASTEPMVYPFPPHSPTISFSNPLQTSKPRTSASRPTPPSPAPPPAPPALAHRLQPWTARAVVSGPCRQRPCPRPIKCADTTPSPSQQLPHQYRSRRRAPWPPTLSRQQRALLRHPQHGPQDLRPRGD